MADVDRIRIVAVAGEQIALTRMEFDLLVSLAEHPRRVFFRSQLLQSAWGYKVTGGWTVDVHVRRLRVKLGASLVTTVRGIGYRLADEARARIVQLHRR
jgi:DNA-binding response OmpR family regulator